MYVWFALTEWGTYEVKLPHPSPLGGTGPLSIPREAKTLIVI